MFITEQAKEKMIAGAKLSEEKETGEVVVDNKLIVTGVSGSNAVKKEDWFEYDVGFCQHFLEAKALESKNHIKKYYDVLSYTLRS